MFNIKLGETEYVNAKVENINRGDHFYNATVILDDDNRINIKIFDGNIYLEIGKVYQFEIVKTIKNEDIIYELNNVVPIEHLYSGEGLLDILHTFYHYAPIGLKDIKLAVEGYLKKIKDPVLNKLTNAIYDDYKDQYYLHPAATKFHHAYVGGLIFHSLTMLKLADS